MKAYRAALLRFDPRRDPHHAAVYEEDGLLVVGQGGGDLNGVETVLAAGSYLALIDLN